MLKRLGKPRRHAWPDTVLLVRGDRHVTSPEVLAWSEAQAHLHDVTGWTGTAVFKALARGVVEQAQRASERDGGKIPRFHQTRSQAGTWSCSRRVVIKVAVSEQGVNTRFVVTDLEQARTTVLSRPIDGARGQMENDIKDHKLS